MSVFSGFEVVAANDCDFSDNKLKNGSFESGKNGVTDWTADGVSLSRSSGYEVCGSYYGLMHYDGRKNKTVRVYQDVKLDDGITAVKLTIWGGVHDKCNAEFRLVFLNSNGQEISAETRTASVTKEVSKYPYGLKKYSLENKAPQAARKVRVEARMKRTDKESGVYFKIEAALLTFESPSLPVTLSAFSGRSSETGIALSWQTTEEAGSESFEVQHSLDGASWNAIGQVAAKGDYKGLSTYDLFHGTASAGQHYYRLKMTDRDGSSEMSRIIAVEHSSRYAGEAAACFYPNPSRGKVQLQVPDHAGNIVVYDLTGRAVSRTARMENNEEMDLSRLENGAYLVSWSDGRGRKFSQRLIISR
ncbi:MAG: hypothetical protein ABS46_07185 [Cytophagaceae bacterium SCN 52-12]|nr:MAG: hypothetical protein ABS46_07185 [Cytophagaceae bacterium SCN 52-12]